MNQNAVSYSTATGGDAISNTNMYDACACPAVHSATVPDSVSLTVALPTDSNRDEFFFAVANGIYNVTVAIGTPSQPCSQYKEYVEVMGLVVYNTTAVCTGTGTRPHAHWSADCTCLTGVREYSIVVQVVDNMLACAFSGWAERYDATAYASVHACQLTRLTRTSPVGLPC